MISPIQFKQHFKLGDHVVEYQRLNELGQGGPEIGQVKVNSVVVDHLLFGGPAIVTGKIVYLPLWWGNAFVPAVLDVDAREVWRHEQAFSLVLIESVIGTSIKFFTDLNNSVMQQVELRDFYRLAYY